MSVRQTGSVVSLSAWKAERERRQRERSLWESPIEGSWLVRISEARRRGPDAVAGVVCRMPAPWRDRIGISGLKPEELRAVEARRREMSKGVTLDTACLILGVRRFELMGMVGEGLIDPLGTEPPSGVHWFWHKETWPPVFRRMDVLSLAASRAGRAFRDRRRTRMKFRRHELRLAGAAR
jgi:hypothetical protein